MQHISKSAALLFVPFVQPGLPLVRTAAEGAVLT
jgi:hypothetical protein